MELNFYHVSDENLVPVIIKLLEKIYNNGKHCIFYSPIEDRVKLVDKTLWTFSKDSFIPHGDKSLGFLEKQPIYFTNEINNPNSSENIIMVDSFDYLAWHTEFEKIIFVFEDKEQEENANILFNDLKNKKVNVNYWRQSNKGWEKVN